MEEYKVVWNLLTDEFKIWIIMVGYEYRHKGVATTLTEMTEKVARELGAKTLIFEDILETSMEYWRKRSDVIVDENRHKAIKLD